MDKQTYQAKYKELFNQRSALTEELRLLEEQYIEANKPCEVGDTVEAESRNGFKQKAIVTGFHVGSSGNVEPYLRKAKKDGTASQHKVYWYDAAIIHYPVKSPVELEK